ncbi:MAG: esterase-like activity of phytase family protein [Cyclobacteriaceae bacterium]
MKNVRLIFVIVLTFTSVLGTAQGKLEATLIADITLKLSDKSLGGFSGITWFQGDNWKDGIDFVMVSDASKDGIKPYRLQITLKTKKIQREKDVNPRRQEFYNNPDLEPESVRFRNGLFVGTSEGKSTYWKKVWFLYPERKTMSFTPIKSDLELKKNSGFEAFDIQSNGVWWVGLERQNDEPSFDDPCPDPDPIKTTMLVSSMGKTLTYSFRLDPDSVTCRQGLSDMVFYNDTTLITLERRWEPIKDRVLAGLYEVNMNTGKTNSLSLIHEKVEKVGNLEGMSLGPAIKKNGIEYISLIVIADNNFGEGGLKNQILLFGLKEN